MTMQLSPIYIGSRKKMALQLVISILFIVFLSQALYNVVPILDGLEKESKYLPRGDVSNVVFFTVPLLAIIPGVYSFMLLNRELTI